MPGVNLTLAIPQLYVTGCIEVLKYVHTPWSESVEELAQACLKVDHPHVPMLEKQYHLLQLKKLLNGYEIKNVNFSDHDSSCGRVSWMVCCAYCIYLFSLTLNYVAIYSPNLFLRRGNFIGRCNEGNAHTVAYIVTWCDISF